MLEISVASPFQSAPASSSEKASGLGGGRRCRRHDFLNPMPNASLSFQCLMQKVLAGNAAAARELTDVYGPYLLHAVRRRLDQRLRAKFDSVDFVQDIWASFFAGLPSGRAFERPQDLAAFLIRMAKHKVSDAARQRIQGQKFNVTRERPLEETNGKFQFEPAARQATPSTRAVAQEEWERLLEGQPPVYRRILELLRDGADTNEVAKVVGVSERTVRRVRGKFLPGLAT